MTSASPSTALAILPLGDELAPAPPCVATDRAEAYAAEARAANTRRAYTVQFKLFAAWCSAAGHVALPASGAVVAAYLASLADRGLKAASISLALTAISQVHTRAGYASPRKEACVAETWRGIRRTLGTAQTGKAPLYGAELLAAVRALPATLAGARDKAILLLGYAGAFRRSELVGLDVEDLRRVPRGLEVTIRRSKTDQEGRGRTIAIPREAAAEACPVRAVEAWLSAAQIMEGPIFRRLDRRGGGARLGAHHVARVCKVAALAGGLDPAQVSGHSLRAGLVTAAARDGRSDRSIMRTTGHRSAAMIGRYVRGEGAWEDVAGEGLLSRATHP